MKNKKLLFITQTAVMIAVLIGTQLAAARFGQFVVGPLVNTILIVSALTIGAACPHCGRYRNGGLIVAAVSPFVAFFFQIGPVIQIVPFIAVGNIVQVTIVSYIRKFAGERDKKSIIITAAGLVTASAAKWLVLWFGITKIALSMLPELPDPEKSEARIATMTAMFTWPPLLTALIGSALAMGVMFLLKKALPTTQTQ
jgi:hypothetical protein